jgi:NTP pyrophosphatase (non-canonical NTP hydrolase)
MTMHIRQAQGDLWDNKVAKGFNQTDVPTEFMLLMGEVGEAIAEWRRGDRESLGTELADVALFTMALAEMNGIDLDACVERKLAVNASRSYVLNPDTGLHSQA